MLSSNLNFLEFYLKSVLEKLAKTPGNFSNFRLFIREINSRTETVRDIAKRTSPLDSTAKSTSGNIGQSKIYTSTWKLLKLFGVFFREK